LTHLTLARRAARWIEPIWTNLRKQFKEDILSSHSSRSKEPVLCLSICAVGTVLLLFGLLAHGSDLTALTGGGLVLYQGGMAGFSIANEQYVYYVAD
jgi:hypothetical protein